MLGFHFGRKREKIVAIIDVGSSSVAVAIVALSPDASANVCVSLRRTLSFEKREPRATVHAIIMLMRETLSQVAQEYSKSVGARTIDECHAIFHTPWVRSRSIVATNNFNAPTRITDDLIVSLAQKAIRTEIGVDYTALFESTVTNVALDGYYTNAPVGKTASRIGVTCLLSDGNANIIKATQGALQTICANTPNLHSSIRSVYATMKKLSPELLDYVIVDIEDDATCVTTIRDGAIAEQSNVSEGLRSLLERIGCNGLLEDTLSTVRMVTNDACSSTACITTKNAMIRIEPDIVRVFAESMARMSTARKLPNTIVLIAHADLREWLAQCFTRIDFAQFTFTARPFTVETLSSEELSSFVRGSVDHKIDSGIAIATSVVNSQL